MKGIRRIIPLMIVMSVGLAGCGSRTAQQDTDAAVEDGQKDDITDEAKAAGEQPEAPGIPSGNEDVPLVGIVTYSGGIEDGGFNQSAWEGLQRLSGMTGCETKFLESYAEGDLQKNIHSLIEAGGDLCWGTGYGCEEVLLEEAKEHPETSFAIIDYAYEDTPSNMTGVMFRAQESSFLAGYVAGSVTETGKIGFVGGETNEVIDQFQYGFQAGVLYAGRESGRDISVETAYAGTFSDSKKGRELADELYGKGCDIVFHAAGETGTGVIEAAREAGKYAIGVDKDQAYLAPSNVLTSVLKDVNTAVYRVSCDFISGEDIGGKTVELGLAEDAVGLSEDHSLYSDEIYDKMLSLKDEIAEGKLVPPASGEEYDSFAEQN
ncbi:MAG: BMP family ABC transporter substrate-binding protein [Lachnospiraceae bacterium]|nr:BMP family ABC transporter substrate-binding protein [Lachnospiraceae bacterium]